MSGPVVSFKGVTKNYKDNLVLDGISFSMGPGQVFGFIGPNGAGKTTTIRIMTGLITDHTGDVRVNGHPMPGERTEASRDFGYMPQQIAFQEWRTVDSALRTLGRLSGLSRRDLNERIPEVLDMVGIPETRKKNVKVLSGGTLQKVGLAQALLHRPGLLVLDEPMSGLDPAARYNFKRIIKDLSRSGISVFFSSHILSDVQDLADTIGILKKGSIAWTGTFEELRRQFDVSNDFDIRLSLDSGRWKDLIGTEGFSGLSNPGPGHLIASIDRNADPDLAVHTLLVGLIERGCRVRSITPMSPNLEELYVRYVGGDEE